MQQEKDQPLGELIIQYEPKSGMMRKILRGTPMPLPMLVNFLELLKLEVLTQEMQMAMQAQQQGKVMVPNGATIPNLRA